MGRGKDVEAIFEKEKDDSSDGECNGDVDGTNGGGDVDSNRVEAVRLVADSQQRRNNAKTQRNDLPMLPESPG